METIEWKVSNTPVPYPESVEFMAQTVQSIISGTGRELVWLLEHPDIYTRGSSARANELNTSLWRQYIPLEEVGVTPIMDLVNG